MKKKLFLSGPPCSGKSGMIIEALGGSLACAGGYFTRKLFSGDGAPLGLELLPAAAAAGVEGFKALRYIDLGGGRPVKDNEVFRTEAVRLLNEAEYYPFAVTRSPPSSHPPSPVSVCSRRSRALRRSAPCSVSASVPPHWRRVFAVRSNRTPTR